MTGTFPVVSLEGMHDYFIAYDYDTNAIIPKTVPDLNDYTLVKVFEEVFNELKHKRAHTRTQCY